MILVQPQLLLLIKLVRIVDLVSHNRVERLLPLAEPARQLLFCILPPHRKLAIVSEEDAEVVIVSLKYISYFFYYKKEFKNVYF